MFNVKTHYVYGHFQVRKLLNYQRVYPRSHDLYEQILSSHAGPVPLDGETSGPVPLAK